MLGIFDLFSGGTFRQMTIPVLGIMLHIAVDHLAVDDRGVPAPERLQKEGELGRCARLRAVHALFDDPAQYRQASTIALMLSFADV